MATVTPVTNAHIAQSAASSPYQRLALGFHVMAGPCSIETQEQIRQTAAFLASRGVKILRGGAFKPRTSPRSFQGLGEPGLQLLREAADAHGMLAVSEVMDVEAVPLVAEYVDVFQVGARNMQNFSLLKRLAKERKPVLLKRGLAATVDETLCAAEYILQGNPEVVLCERGVRGFEPLTRNMLDLSGAALLRQLSPLPVIVDLSHSTGRTDIVAPLAAACVALGVNGMMVEVHPRPAESVSDAAQAISFERFDEILATMAPYLAARAAVEAARQPAPELVEACG
ncbi:MAG: 3-deoxy-7-phosphoheptulonate synthase [bacterium]|nr:3-deoxy-7-phosphoheptulonate synthase [bacterium]